MVVLGDEGRVQYLISVNLEIVQILMQDSSTICVIRNKGSEIDLDTLDGTRR